MRLERSVLPTVLMKLAGNRLYLPLGRLARYAVRDHQPSGAAVRSVHLAACVVVYAVFAFERSVIPANFVGKMELRHLGHADVARCRLALPELPGGPVRRLKIRYS